MAALRYAARRFLIGQPRQPIYMAAVAEEQRRLLPRIIHGGSSAYSRRFISIQPSDTERLTLEEKWRISKRVAHVIYRITKAVSIMVASGMIIKLSVNELFSPRYFLRETAPLHQDNLDFGNNPKEADIEYILKDGMTLEAQRAELESVLAEFESALKSATPRVPKQRFSHPVDPLN